MSGVRTHEESLAYAADHNLVVLYPTPNQVFIDLDGVVDPNTHPNLDKLRKERGETRRLATFLTRLQEVQRFFPAREVSRTTSKSGYGLHIIVDVGTPLAEPERLLVQAILCSDPKREILGLLYLRKGEVNVSRFFENAETHLQIVANLALAEEAKKEAKKADAFAAERRKADAAFADNPDLP